MKNEIRAALIGCPNCGKTTLFNALTGANLKTANYPGVTVEKREGICRIDRRIRLVDLPGTYSLDSYSLEERISKDAITSDKIDVILNIADASAVKRSLALTLELIALGKPTVLALNMMDIAQERGMKIDHRMLGELLGIPVIPICARDRSGLDVLIRTIEAGLRRSDFSYRIGQTARTRSPDMPIEEILAKTVFAPPEQKSFTEKADAILTHPYLGIPIFLAIMALVFMLTFTVGDRLKGILELLFTAFSDIAASLLRQWNVGELLCRLIVDGIIAGVGGVLMFLPNIAILFFALALLEDSGYMPRAAYIMDDIMARIGLSGRAFIPMLLGFGCTVPAIMATRTLESHRDRIKTILITPFMSCSARLPVYVLFSSMFFGNRAGIAAFSMYLIGLVMAILTAGIYQKICCDPAPPLLLELPEYRMPDMRSIFSCVRQKLQDYLTKAGTTIFLASIVMWVLMSFGIHGYTADIADSFAADIAKLFLPIMKPIGLGYWQIIAALISGIAAKEVILSSLSVLYGIENIASSGGMASLASMLASVGFTAANAYAMMVFVLLYIPCAASIAAIRRESGSVGFTLFAVFIQLISAWITAAIVYNSFQIIL